MAEARRRQRAAVAAAAPPVDGAVDVNLGSDEELRKSLGAVMQLPQSIADRIVLLRPFSSKADLLERVNAEQPSARQCIGVKLAVQLYVSTSDAEQEPEVSRKRGTGRPTDPVKQRRWMHRVDGPT